MRLAVTIDGLALKFAEPELRADLDIVLWAVKNITEAWARASPECRRDPVVRRAVGVSVAEVHCHVQVSSAVLGQSLES